MLAIISLHALPFLRKQEGEPLFPSHGYLGVSEWEGFEDSNSWKGGGLRNSQNTPNFPHTMVHILFRFLLCVPMREMLKTAGKTEKTCGHLFYSMHFFLYIISLNQSLIHLSGSHDDSHFIDEKTKAQSHSKMHLRSHRG